MGGKCCICGEVIDGSHKLDPCYIEIVTNAWDDDADRLQQSSVGHYDCIKKVIKLTRYLIPKGEG
jgi:hypothetical protein